MGFLQKARTVVLAHMNDLVDKAIDMNSIPVLKQYVRDLEDAIDSANHQAAVSRAQATTLIRERHLTSVKIAEDMHRAQAFLASNDEKNARIIASRIHDDQTTLDTLEGQIKAAQEQGGQLDSVVQKLKSKHDAILSRVRDLDRKDQGSKAMEKATASIKSAGAVLDSGVDSRVDNLSQRIEERNDLAKEEFNRTVGDLDEPEDPLKAKAVDDILASLRPTPAAV